MDFIEDKPECQDFVNQLRDLERMSRDYHAARPSFQERAQQGSNKSGGCILG